MPDSVYKVITLVGSSETSWEEATKNAVAEAAKHLRDLRVAEIDDLDVRLEDNHVAAFRAKVRVSFRYEGAG